MSDAVIRPYRPADHRAGRSLWVESIEQHRQLYDDPLHGGDDPGAAFEEYLTRLDLSGVWVAELPDVGVVGMVGLIVSERGGRIEPVVVTARLRGRGIGRALLGRVADEARRRGLPRLTVTPASRNVTALRCLHSAGYDVLSAIELTLDLRDAPTTHHQNITLQGLPYRS